MFDAITQLVARSKSLRIVDEGRLRRLSRVDAVVLVGATCAGKSTLAAAIRGAAWGPKGRVDVPSRCLTRPRRQNESPGENVHLSADEFEQSLARGEVGLHWARKMEGGREERYGFRPVPKGMLAVYSGNNALYSNQGSVQPQGALRHALFVGVHAPDEIREARLRARSPDLWAHHPAEVAHRLADRSDNMLKHVHLVVANHGTFEGVAPEEAVALVKVVEAALAIE